MSKPILYTFGSSVWAAVPELAIQELGYAPGSIGTKTINLVEGENFDPTFITKNPHATLPTLEVSPSEIYTSTAEVTAYLISHAPVKVKKGDPVFIKKIHEEQYDPNFAVLLARDADELNAKRGGFPYKFLANRQKVLLARIEEPASTPFKSFFESKLAGNGGLLAIYEGKVPNEVLEGFFDKSQAHFKSVGWFIYNFLPDIVPQTGFLGGDTPGEDDYHLCAWLTRIAGTVGATGPNDMPDVLSKSFGKPLPSHLKSYISGWTSRASWKKVYETKLH
ncbi:hypothetical protein FISHEDRAFT_66967 [Fistulina hepatica ATCC 64428]|uniref:GST N-terminal domain-containing protein n=1 Tax=Fistulina hepatica ATCC 64428 TaxID=1128425 RepID=A0A0D7A661_9AGAR|nr:hypothetical protein FISHEDRAFT_66967 [Fistulina hepatica ATCC 64428]